MTWVLVFGGIALAGIVMIACFAVWLWRKATALLRETGVLMDRAGDLLSLLEQIEVPDRTMPDQFRRAAVFDGRDDDEPATATRTSILP